MSISHTHTSLYCAVIHIDITYYYTHVLVFMLAVHRDPHTRLIDYTYYYNTYTCIKGKGG